MHNTMSDEPSSSGVGGSGGGGDAFTVKRIMATPALIKSKFLSVLDSGNGIFNGLSSKVNTSRSGKW